MFLPSARKHLFFFLFIALLTFFSFSAVSAFADAFVDNRDPGTSYIETEWSISGGTDPYDDDSLWARDGATFTWGFDSQPPGTYEVSMWWSGWTSRATDIGVEINHSGGSETISIDQQENAGQWNSLGRYYFDSSGSVTITAAYGSSVSTCADAVWFQFISDNTPPTAYIDSISPNPAEPGQLIEFVGDWTDNEDNVVAYQWESSIDGLLSELSSFTTSSLSEATHTISFKVLDDQGLWSETVTEVLIVGTIPTEIIIDNRDDTQTSQSEPWRVSGASDPYGADSVYSRDGETFTWDFTPPQTGDYEVSMWWTEWSSRSDSVPVTINHEGGPTTVNVNQQENGGQWNSLHICHFDVNSGGSVTITAQPGPSSTCADAVKFNFVSSNDPPTATIVSISPNPQPNAAEPVDFTGEGEDPDGGTIEACLWNSSINGDFGSELACSAVLSEGTHLITFTVQDDELEWSVPATQTLVVGTPSNAPPTAFIDSITPNPANIGETVSFTGHGEDSDGSITIYIWESSIDDVLSYEPSFTTSSLSEGTHTITLVVYDDEEAASEPVTQVLTIEDMPIEVEIDNGGADSTWKVSGGSDPWGADSLWSRDGETYTWTFSPTVSSYYEVFMWWTEWSSRSTRVPVDIEHSDGMTTDYVNQQENGGRWNSLDAYFFESGSTYRVTITAQPGPSSTCADAIKFVKTSDPGTNPPAANFSADKTFGGAPCTIHFYDQSMGTVTEWLWDFGDGQTSVEQNPSHEYTDEGTYTVSLTVTNSYGSDTETREFYIQIFAAFENIYLCDGYSKDALFIPWCITKLRSIGAVENNGVWVYTNPDKGTTYFVHTVRSVEGMEQAIKEEGAHLIYNGHANYGLAAFFATSAEVAEQRIYDVLHVDDDRFLNLCTDMVSIKVDGMQSGQAYPNWTPYLKYDGCAIMPYEAIEGMPPYNYYLMYTIPGDPTVYNIELGGDFVERFPDSRKPAWDFTLSGGAPPDPYFNPEYFITNPGDEYNHCEITGNWSMGGDCYAEGSECLGYNYHYIAPGSGADIATWFFVVEIAGNYYVDASWESSPSNATDAKYTIYHSGGSTVVEADQTVNTATGWNRLGGEYHFDEGMNIVELNNNANGTVIADAVQLSPVGNPDDIIKSEFRARSAVSGAAPLTVEFDARSYASEEITEWRWDFGDGSPDLVLDELPSWGDPPITHTYSSPSPDIYTVSLRVTDALGRQDTEIKEGFVAVGMDPPLHAEFTQTSGMINVGESVRFADQSSGDITSWSWDFDNDGTEDSTDQNPLHTYEAPGTYTVTLTVTGPGGSDTETEVDFIDAIMPICYTDNSYQYKSHFTSWGGTGTFGKVVLDVSSATIPEEELRYSRFFYGSCNSCNYYMGSLNRGVMFCTTRNQTAYVGHHYLRDYLLGDSDDEILSHLNGIYEAMDLSPIYEYYNFNLKPPSMR